MAAHGLRLLSFLVFARGKYAARLHPVLQRVGWYIARVLDAIAQPLSAGSRHRGVVSVYGLPACVGL